MIPKIDINIGVDTIGALSDRTLEGNIFLFDTCPYKTPEQGTSRLTTYCTPGQRVNWVIYPIDLETPASIKSILFTGAEPINYKQKRRERGKSARSEQGTAMNADLDAFQWTGIVPYMDYGVRYCYRLEIQMGQGPNSVMYIDTLALARL